MNEVRSMNEAERSAYDCAQRDLLSVVNYGVTKLDLSNRNLTHLPPEIGQFAELREINLSGNQLVALGEIEKCTQLREVDLRQNLLLAVPQEITRLPNLQSLCLNDNRLSILPGDTQSWSNLRSLELSGNRLTELPAGIGECNHLEILEVNRNRLSSVPPEIGNCTQLRVLSLNDNKLTQLPVEIGNCRALTALWLSNNQLLEMPPQIGHCKHLERLGIQNNRLHALPEEIEQCGDLVQLFLHGNIGLNIPPDVLGPTSHAVKAGVITAPPRAILDYYFSRQTQGERPLNEVKLVFVGRGGAGKSSLVERLIFDSFTPGRAETLGVDLNDWTMSECPGGEPVTAHVWDFAGQVIAHSLHVFFFSVRTVYVLVLTGRENAEREDAEYWLRLISAFGSEQNGEGPPVIIALNKCDDAGSARPKLDRGNLRERYPFIVDFISTDCETGTGIDLLREKLSATVGTMPWVRNGFPSAWFNVKEALSRPERPHISYNEYRNLCRSQNVVGEDAQDSLAETLSRLGIAINFRDDQRLKFATVLHPQWLTSNVYELLRAAERNKGVLKRAELVEILHAEQNQDMHMFLIDLMDRFEIAYPVVSEEQEVQKWLIPLAMPDDQPPGVELFANAKDAARLRYTYGVLPAGLVPRFIVRTHPYIERRRIEEADSEQVWASGVILAFEGARALVRSPMSGLVEIVVTGPVAQRQRLAGLCQAEFRAIHAGIAGLNPIEETIAAEKWVSVTTLEKDERRRQRTGVSTSEGTVQVDPTAELNEFTTPIARDDSWKPRVFISYAHSDESKRKLLDLRLKMLFTAGLVHPGWHDRKIDPGDDWDGSIKQQLNDADVIIFMVSAASLASDYINNTEMQRAFARESGGNAIIVPLILERCHWDKTQLKNHQALPKDAKPISDWTPRSNGWHDVALGLERLFAKLREERRRRPSGIE